MLLVVESADADVLRAVVEELEEQMQHVAVEVCADHALFEAPSVPCGLHQLVRLPEILIDPDLVRPIAYNRNAGSTRS